MIPQSKRQAEGDLTRYETMLQEAKKLRGVSLWRDAWRQLRKNRVAMISLWILAALSLLAIFTPALPLQPPRHVDMDRRFQAPNLKGVLVIKDSETGKTPAIVFDQDEKALARSLEAGFGKLGPVSTFLLHARVKVFGAWSIPSICGCDNLGRDILSRVFWGARLSLAVGLVATLVSLVIGVSYGAISGYLGGWVDNAMMRAVDVMYSIPFIFVVVFIISIVDSPSFSDTLKNWGLDRMTVFFLIVGAIYWLTMARVVRGQVISLRNEPFVEAARTIGASQMRIVFRHLVPNLLSVVIVYLTLTIPRVMLFEAFLSFLGLGVQAPDVSWGLLANEGLKVSTPISGSWWLVVFPGIALGITLWALNFLGDGLRDALDPKLKNR